MLAEGANLVNNGDVMKGYKKVICIGDFGFPSRLGRKKFFKVGSIHKSGGVIKNENITIPDATKKIELKKDDKYWVPESYDLYQEGSLFKEYKVSKKIKEK